MTPKIVGGIDKNYL